jgi:FkbM family methyltransferase
VNLSHFLVRAYRRLHRTRCARLLGVLRARLLGIPVSSSETVFRGYLDDLWIKADRIYPIEAAMLYGCHESHTLALIQRLVRPDHVCLDIGANVGAITLALAKAVGPRGLVLAFEPGELLFQRLQHNLGLNPRFRKIVKPLCLGLGDRPVTLYWAEDQNNRGNASLWATAETGKPVRVVTLDSYLAEHPLSRLDFVKIDIEGMELEFIKGGIETWKKYRPALYYETMPAFEVFRNTSLFLQIQELLRPLGYRFYKVMPNGELRETHYPDLSDNTLALAS